MGVTTTLISKPFNPRGNDQSPLAYNKAAIYSGKALSFDGVNDSVSVPTNSAFNFGTNNFTLSGHLKITAGGSFSQIFGTKGSTGPASGYTLYYQYNTGKFLFSNANGSSFSEIYTSDSFSEYVGQWVHIVAVRDSSDAKNGLLYVNGIKAELASTMTIIDGDNTNPFTVGVATGPNHYGKQQMTNVKVFNTALTAAQVADLYNFPEKIVPTGVANTALKLWLPMQEGAGTTAYDGSGNGNHGTISGATYVNGVGAPVAQTAVIDWNKGTNRFTYSEQFETTDWNKISTSITANTLEAPDGQITADTLNSTASTEAIYQLAPVGVNSISLYAKAKTTTSLQLASTTSFNGRGADFNLLNGTAGSVYQIGSGSGTISGGTSAIENVGNGWYRCSINSLTLTAVRAITIANNNGSGSYIWGAQVEQSSSVGPYVRTGATAQTTPVLLPQGLTAGRDITGVNLFENVRKQGALNLDGNSWAEVHDNASLDMTPAMSLECWINCGDELNADYDHVFVKPASASWASPYGTYVLRLNNSSVQWWFDSVSRATSYSVALTGWNYLSLTKNGTSEIFYLNGVQVKTFTGASSISSTAFDLIIGTHTSKSTHESIANQLAQPRIYNRALTAEEVQRNYDAGKNIYTN